MKKRRIWVGIAIVVLIPILVPLITLPHAKGDIVRSLQASLGRKITANSVHLELVPLPGIELDNLEVADGPAFGLEDMVMAESATANLSVWNLLRGRVVFSHIHLQNPSINLVRDPAGRWNIAALLDQTRRAHAASGHPVAAHFPYIDWSDARVNFKFDQTKTHFYLDQVKGSLARDGGGWRLHLSFVPVRSDLNLSNTGVVTLDGRWGKAAGAQQAAPFDMAVHLRQSYLAGSTALIVGHDAGVHGVLGAALQVQGTSRQFSISGTVTAQSLRRWDLLPTAASITASLAATYMPAQDLLQITGIGDPGWKRVQLTGSVQHLFSSPRAGFALRLHDLPAADLLPFALALKANLPASLSLSGVVNGTGSLAWSPRQGMPAGHARLQFAKLQLQDRGASLRLAKASLVWNGRQLQFLPVTATLSRPGLDSTLLRLSGSLDPRHFTLSVASPALSASSAGALAHLLGVESPWPVRVSGIAAVGLRLSAPWSQFRDVHWSGEAAFTHARFHPPGGSSLALSPLRVQMGAKLPLAAQFALTQIPLRGSVSWAADGSMRFTVNGVGVHNQTLWSLLRPASSSFLQRVFGAVLGSSATAPTWLQNLQASGEVHLRQLDWHGIRSNVNVRLSLAPPVWRATQLDIGFAQGQFHGDGHLAPGAFVIAGAVAAGRPLHLVPLLASTPYAGTLAGTLSGSLSLRHPLAGGSLRQIRASGVFRLRDGWLATSHGHWLFQDCTGRYQLRQAQATFSELVCRARGLRYTGSGAAQFGSGGHLTYSLALHRGKQTLHLRNGAPPSDR